MDTDQESQDQSIPVLESNSPARASTEDPVVDEETEVLGEDSPSKVPKEVNLHTLLVSRWKEWLKSGISKEVKQDLLQRYPRQGNCGLEAPRLNPEVRVFMNEAGFKRDNHFVNTQNLSGSALSALGSAMTKILYDEETPADRLVLLEELSNIAQLLTEIQHNRVFLMNFGGL